MQDSYTIPLDLTLREWYKVAFFSLPRTKIFKRLFLFTTAIQLLFDLTSLPMHFQTGRFTAADALSFVGLPIFILAFFSACMLLGGIFIDKFNPGLMRGSVNTYTATGLEIAAPSKHRSIPWRQFTRLLETRDFLFIGLSIGEQKIEILHPVLKRHFADEAAFLAFKKFLEKQLPL